MLRLMRTGSSMAVGKITGECESLVVRAKQESSEGNEQCVGFLALVLIKCTDAMMIIVWRV